MTLSTLPTLALPIGDGGHAGHLDHRERCLDDPSDHYHYYSTVHAFTEVLWRRKLSPTPNAERASALTHAAAAAIWIAYALGRALLAPADSSLGATMHVASIATFALTYGVSTAFHVYKTVEAWAPWMRTADFSAVYLGLAVNGLAVVAIAGDNGKDTPLLTWLDPVLAPGVLFTFFFLRRALVDYDETYLPDQAECARRPYRVWHSDLEHVTLRQAGSFALAYGWVLMAPSAFLTLDHTLAGLWLGAAPLSSLILTFGAILLVGLIGDGYHACCGPPSRPFCWMGAHAWWHVMACASNAVMIAAREVVLAYR